MNQQQMKDFSSQVLERSQELGADGGDVVGRSGRSFSVSVQRGEIDKYKVSSSAIIGLRVIKNQRVGLAYTESFDRDSLRRVAQQAVENAQYAAVDEHQNIEEVEPKELLESNKDIYQEDHTPLDDKLSLAIQMEQKLLQSDKRVASSPYNGYSDGEVEAIYLNHLGNYRFHRERSFYCYVSALTRDGDKQAMYGYSINARRFAELDPNVCVEQTLNYALPLLSAMPIPTGRYDVIFETDELEQILGSFLSTFSAKDVLDGRSGLRGKLGEKIATEGLTLRDEPQFTQGFYYSQFDDEGLLRQPLVLIENGVLKSFLHNTATAKQMNTVSTAHGSRSAKSSLGISATQPVISVGTDADDEVLARDHLRIISLKGLHSGTNPVSGHFSLALEGVLYKGGKVHQYVKDVTISGNFYELLQKIDKVGDRLHANATGSFFSPYILFRQLSIAGS
ncbi:MAG: TldD/PmbA family protein [Oligoflexus sp.]